MAPKFRTGVIAIVGRPNTGKSTLLNQLVGAKISSVSRRPQTTRHAIQGVVSENDAQLIFIDTPGFQTEHGGTLNRLLNRSVTNSLKNLDAIVLVVEAGRITAQDRKVMSLLPASIPVVLALNKIDRLPAREALLPVIDKASRLHAFAEIVPVSALKGSAIADLVNAIKPYLPEGEARYSADTLTDRSERFLAAQFIQETLFQALGEELPYSTTVLIDRFEEAGSLRRIYASIIVDKQNQKAIVIGAGGQRLKSIASKARREMERLFGGKVYLEVWVRVKRGWADDLRFLHALGYG
ncbi:MAG: GTPase Era [Burkholderiales bacterium]